MILSLPAPPIDWPLYCPWPRWASPRATRVGSEQVRLHRIAVSNSAVNLPVTPEPSCLKVWRTISKIRRKFADVNTLGRVHWGSGAARRHLLVAKRPTVDTQPQRGLTVRIDCSPDVQHLVPSVPPPVRALAVPGPASLRGSRSSRRPLPALHPDPRALTVR